MDKRLALMPLLVLAVPSLSGCVAAAIPALAGAGVVGSQIDGKDPAARPAPMNTAPAPSPTPTPTPTPTSAPAPQERVTVVTITPPPSSPPSQAPSPVQIAPAPTPAPKPAPVVTAPPVIPATAPVVVPVIDTAPPAMPVASAPAAPPSPAAAITAPVATAAPVSAYPDPRTPIPADQGNFARFVRYGQASARGAQRGADLLSAVLSDPVALDGKRRRCVVGEQMVALIDLDPAGGTFSPPANPVRQPGLALGLAVLREAGVEIAWFSDLPVNQSGALRAALERAGLDPRGQDIISLSRDEGDTKQQRKDNLAGITCIIAIAGDERPDFDMRFKYLRSPEAGAGLEPLIGDGWFLIQPLLTEEGQ